jgi:hypothetical protein
LTSATIGLLVMDAGAKQARADLLMQVSDSTALVGGTGSFEVSLTSTGGSFDVAGFSFELSVLGASGVTFTGVDTSTVINPYIFGTFQSPPPFSFDTFPNTSFTASDVDFALPGFTTLNSGDTFALGRVTYQIAANATPGPATVSFLDLGVATSLSDVTGASIAFTTSNGTIDIRPNGVPEPSTLLVTAIGMSSAWVFRRRRAKDVTPIAAV